MARLRTRCELHQSILNSRAVCSNSYTSSSLTERLLLTCGYSILPGFALATATSAALSTVRRLLRLAGGLDLRFGCKQICALF